jgi:DNA-binding MarR family transcriptional regulator/N-acetylglutamate synthase-like GNAT family acetyltransferase
MSALEQRAAEVRRFTRFYTRRIGVLGETMLKSRFSLTEARLLYELANRENATAAVLCAELGLDPGYMSRILARFTRDGLIRRKTSDADARQSLISITAKGRKAFAPLDARSQSDVVALLEPLSHGEQQEVVSAMKTIERLVERQADAPPYVLREPRPGDFGWIISRHGSVYAQERGWNAEFEALCAEIVADFAKSNDPARERCWIAERGGENVGCVFVVRQDDQVAKLRLLMVEPHARGLGIGARLVDECLRFARQAGYRKMTLWTQANLTAARAIYERAGFRLAKEEPHHSFGHDLVGEYWEMKL